MNELKALLGQPLAMDPRYVPTLIESIRSEASMTAADVASAEPPELKVSLFGDSGEPMAMEDASEAAPGSVIAVVSLTGTITRHSTWRTVGTVNIGRQLKSLDENASVGTIVLDVDSPGGSVYGTAELADIIFGIREGDRTTIVAVADPLMASAATWTATAAEKVYAIGSADVGSIGVISAYTDYSGWLESEGIKVTVARTPDLKARFTGYEPLTDSMKETLEKRNVEAYQDFTAAMARNRGVDVAEVEKRFGGGEVMNARDGVKAGLIDGIASIDEVVSDFVSSRQSQYQKRRSMAASAEIAASEVMLHEPNQQTTTVR